MKDTRETAYRDGATEQTTTPRFKVGDHVLIPAFGQIREQVPHAIYWDSEFGGWMLACAIIGVHEQNYILASERDLWEPHDDGLWSWWIRRKVALPA